MTTYRRIEKVKRQAQAQADRDKAPFCIVRFGDLLYVRSPARARNLCVKHKGEAEIVARVEPQEA